MTRHRVRPVVHVDPFPTSGRATGRVVALAAAIAAVLVVTGAPAGADPAGPTHYQSRVTGVEGAGADLVAFEVLGGDVFLVIHAEPGTTVEIPGYEGEPYVRIAADGTVEVNQRSPARWVNDARYGTADVEVPASADAAAPPDWTVVADGGVYAWHDHRIHWMSPALPPQVDSAADEVQEVFSWDIPMLVNGSELVVHGRLAWVPGTSPLVAASFPLLWLVIGAVLVLRRPDLLRWALLAAATATLVVAGGFNIGLPSGADGEPAVVILPLLAAALVGAGALLGRRPSAGVTAAGAPTSPVPALVTAAAGIPLVVWGVTQLGALTRPILPGSLPTPMVRTITGLALGIGLAALIAAARTARRATALDADAAGDG